MIRFRRSYTRHIGRVEILLRLTTVLVGMVAMELLRRWLMSRP